MSQGRFTGKVALITGGGTGIGAAPRGARLCLLALPFECGRVETVDVMRDSLLLAVRNGNDASVPPDLATLLMLEDGECLIEHALAACGLPRPHEPVAVATSLQTLIEMVDAGLGRHRLSQSDQRLPRRMGRRTLCRCANRRRNRPTPIRPRHRRHPTYPRRCADPPACLTNAAGPAQINAE